MHRTAARAPEPGTGAIIPSIVTSTNYIADPDHSSFASDSYDDDTYFYSRWSNPTVRQLERELAAIEGGEDAVAFASGMGATAGLLLHLLGQGGRLVLSDVCYSGTAELAHVTLRRYGVEVVPVDTSRLDDVARALDGGAGAIHVETPINAITRLCDIEAIARLAHTAGVPLIVDSTLASPEGTRPLELGADYVVHSLTKFIGGHGDAMGGAVISSRERSIGLRSEAAVHFGAALSPFNAWLITRGLVTLPMRMEVHQRNALAVGAMLETHPAVERVFYPMLPSHPQHALAARQMRNGGGVLAVRLRGGFDTVRRMARRLRVVRYAVSLGHQHTLAFWLDTSEMAGVYRLEGDPLARYREWAGDGFLRLSVGLEPADRLIEDLDQALSEDA